MLVRLREVGESATIRSSVSTSCWGVSIGERSEAQGTRPGWPTTNTVARSRRLTTPDATSSSNLLRYL
ncbi:hypothetical protein NJ7G_2585 [Natrinema sp. J7-2]|nr:hypothetical protein NJ7G_2585 [Natrinema sp. J7-2]